MSNRPKPLAAPRLPIGNERDGVGDEHDDEQESDEQDDDEQDDEGYSEHEEDNLSEAVERLEECSFLRYLGHDYEIIAESLPAMCALYFDLLYRSRLHPSLMAETLTGTLEL